MTPLPLPSISALICTRGRGDAILAAVQSILTPQSPCCELLIIDQSSDDSTQQAIQSLPRDPRLRYVRSKTQGKGNALNEGLEMSRGDIVAITDDDCEVSEEWPSRLRNVFAEHTNVVVAYGNVNAVDYDSSQGFIPAYTVPKDCLCTTVWQKLRARGIGANMAVRRDVILNMGGFDPELGPGGKFKACVDGDITLRALLAGHAVYECADSHVDHFGFRSWHQGRRMSRDSFMGIAAAYVKPLRCGRWEALPLLAWEFTNYALVPCAWAIITFAPHKGWQRIFGFATGMVQGMSTNLDRKAMVYRKPAAVSVPREAPDAEVVRLAE